MLTNNNNGTVTPNTPTNSNGTSCVVTFRYKNSEQTLFSNKTINLSVGVAVQGSDGATGAIGPSGVSIEMSPPTQTSTRTNDGNFSTPSAFTVDVYEGDTDYTYDDALHTQLHHFILRMFLMVQIMMMVLLHQIHQIL